MALSLKDPETDALARRIAKLTGESLTEAVRISLSERLMREEVKRGRPADLEKRIEEIAKQFSALPILDDRTPEEIIGYDDNGLPS